MNKFAKNVSVEEDPAYQDFLDAQEVADIRAQEAETKARRKRIFENTKDAMLKAKENKPEHGKIYLLVGDGTKPSIANRDTWEDSEVKEW